MRNVLIISFFHSSQQDVGALRTQRFAQHLPTFGWKPYILTKLPSMSSIGPSMAESENTFYVPSIPLNRPLHLESSLWVSSMLRKAFKILRKVRIEVVFISCPPFHQAVAGIVLKKWFGTKLVVDYRDAWGLNPYRERLDPFRKFVLQGDSRLEGWLLRNTHLLVVSHQEMKDRYLRQFGFLRDRIEVIYNGFDPERLASRQEALFPEFTILHLGNFYAKQKTRDPSLFLSALERVVSEQKISSDQLRVLFIGEKYREIEEMTANRGLSTHVTYLDRVPYDVAMDYLKKSHVLLLIESLDVMTTKVFEYLATGKPMLCLIKPGGELEGLLRRFSGSAHFLSNDLDQIKLAISNCFEEYRTGNYRVKVSDQFRKDFSRIEQARQLAKLLDQLVSGKSPEGLDASSLSKGAKRN